jgi:FlaA1/EpsC-like NDP-sugar epimerase
VLYRHEEKLLTGDSFMDDYLTRILPDKLRLDYLYVRSRSLLTDIDIFFLTLVALLPRVRTTPLPEKVLFWGPLSTFINRYFSWFIADIFIALMAVGISGIIRRLSGPLDLGLERAFLIAIIIALFFSLSNLFLGMGNISWSQARPGNVIDLALSTALATLVVFLLNWFWPGGSLLPRGFMINIGIMCFMLFVAARYRERLFTGLASRWLTRRNSTNSFGLGERVLIVGAGECGQLAAWLLKKSKFSTPYSILGMVDDDPRKQGQTIDRYPVLGQTREIPDLVRENDIGLILFAINEVTPAERERILAICSATTAHLVIIPDLLEYFQSQLSRQS